MILNTPIPQENNTTAFIIAGTIILFLVIYTVAFNYITRDKKEAPSQ